MVQGTEEPSHVQFGDNFDNTLMGKIGMGHIIKGKHHPRDKLDGKEEHNYSTGVVPKIMTVGRNQFFPGKFF